MNSPDELESTIDNYSIDPIAHSVKKKLRLAADEVNKSSDDKQSFF